MRCIVSIASFEILVHWRNFQWFLCRISISQELCSDSVHVFVNPGSCRQEASWYVCLNSRSKETGGYKDFFISNWERCGVSFTRPHTRQTHQKRKERDECQCCLAFRDEHTYTPVCHPSLSASPCLPTSPFVFSLCETEKRFISWVIDRELH